MFVSIKSSTSELLCIPPPPPRCKFLIIAKNGFLAFTDEGANHVSQRLMGAGHQAPAGLAGSSYLLDAGPQSSLAMTAAPAPFPGVCSLQEEWQIRRHSLAAAENFNSEWFKQYRKSILFHWTKSLSGVFQINSVVQVLSVSALTSSVCWPHFGVSPFLTKWPLWV